MRPDIADVKADGPVLSLYFEDIAAGWQQWVLLTADRHHDNPACVRSLETRHLEQAAERGAIVLDFGDLFCAMQGKYDPRSSMDHIRPEDVGEDYLDRIVMHAAEDYGPYADNWLLMCPGNHESNLRRRHGVDVISNLVHRMNTDYGGKVKQGTYGGYVRFMFRMNKTKCHTLRLKYNHGFGGVAAPVTRGVIQTNRQAVYLPDADVVVNGHNHEAWHVIVPRERLTQRGKVCHDIADYIRTPGYKDAYGDGSAGFEVEQGQGPKPQGAVWMRLYYDAHNSRVYREFTLAVQ